MNKDRIPDMTIQKLQSLPTSISESVLRKTAVHESVLRSYQLVCRLREMLLDGTRSDVIVAVIDTVMNSPEKEIDR